MPQLADALYDGEVDAIILNDGYLPILEQTEGYTDFDNYTRILKQFDFTKEVAPVVPNESITVEPFVVYCSGIDARNSDVNIQSLSDVNILAVVNPKSRQILLLNTPRDYFLPLSFNGQLDKLTHAGMYGIDESMRVLDDLYGVETQYYARVNFYGLTKIVDALGGVDVYSEQTFTTKVMQIPDKNGNLYDDYFSFTEGMNYNVDGQAALAFCRERYSFSDGDNQRGRNQMAMIKAIFNKATSPAILSTYGEVLDAVADTMITNMPYEDISSLVKMQLSDMSGWNITSYSVTGYGGTEECYSMPGQALWVMWPDYDTVNVAKDLIAQVMAGQTPRHPRRLSAASAQHLCVRSVDHVKSSKAHGASVCHLYYSGVGQLLRAHQGHADGLYPPPRSSPLRMGLAYLALWALRPKTMKLPWKDELMFILIGITGGSFYFFLQNTASAHTSAANVSILVSMSPILTVILAQLFSRKGEKLGKWVYIGAVVAIAGVVMVVLNGTLSFHLSPLGDLLALAAALMWAVYSILVKKYTERYDNFLVTRRVFLWAFLTSLPLVLLTDGLPSLTPLFTQPNILVSWLFLGVFGNAVCFAIWNIAFKRLGVVITNNYLYATPFVTVVAGWLLLGEKISLMCIIGAVLITLGVIFAGKSDS